MIETALDRWILFLTKEKIKFNYNHVGGETNLEILSTGKDDKVQLFVDPDLTVLDDPKLVVHFNKREEFNNISLMANDGLEMEFI